MKKNADTFDVTIIIPVYNVEDYIEECLQSVADQTAVAFLTIECLLVDDCGADGSMSKVRDFFGTYHGPIKFRIISRENNGGLSAARNTGIRAARGHYLYFLDSDDLLTADCIERLYAVAEAHPTAQIVVGSLRSFPDGEKFQWMADMLHVLPEFSDDVEWIRSHYLQEIPVISCNKLELRDFILENNLFFREGVLHEDEHWAALSYPHVKAMAFVDRVTYLYRVREGSITNRPGAERKKIENMTAILGEMFSRHTNWGRPLLMWAMNWLEYFRYGDFSTPEVTSMARHSFRTLYRILLANPTVPKCARLVVAADRYYVFSRGRWFLRKALLGMAYGKGNKG